MGSIVNRRKLHDGLNCRNTIQQMMLMNKRKEALTAMMYPFLRVDDSTEIAHSELLDGNMVKVYFERPDERDCFHHATCYLPDYHWEDILGFSDEEIKRFHKLLKSVEFLIYCKIQKSNAQDEECEG